MPCITLNGETYTTQALRLCDLLAELNLQQQRVALEQNGQLIPKSKHEHTTICDNDRIEIVHAVGGG